MVAIDVWRPSVPRYGALFDATWIFSGSLFVALSAHIAVPLPFSPVPITGQTLSVLLLGALLGSRRGLLSLLLYLSWGLVGLPVFAGGGVGLARLLGPTGGYLVGLAAAAFVTGLLAERGWDRRVGTALLAMLCGNCVVYAFGLPWLAHFIGGGHLLAAGLLPFIPGDLLKLALASAVLPAGWALLGRQAGRRPGP
jgi:biotin transport system substrate-specific component